MWNAVLGVFLIIHGFIHWIYIAPNPNTPGAPLWSFLTQRWFVVKAGFDNTTAMILGITLISLVTIGFLVSGIGLLTGQDWWRIAAIVSSGVSTLLLVLFWHNWMIAGPILNIVIIILALYWGR